MIIAETAQKQNIEFWESVEKTDPQITKKVEFGKRKYTTIDAQAQIKNVTARFGMYGDTWGIEDERFEFHKDIDLLFYSGLFWYLKDESKKMLPMASAIKMRNKSGIDEDCVKKVRTDAFTKEISRLGFNADVFMGKFDDNKYVSAVAHEFAAEQTSKQTPAKVTSINTAKPRGKLDVGKFKLSVKDIQKEISEEVFETTLKIYKAQSIDQITNNHDRIAFYRTLRSYMNKDSLEFMLGIIDEYQDTVGKSFLNDLLNRLNLKIETLKDLKTKDRETITIVYRAILYKVNLLERAKGEESRQAANN
jgi:hypothetical protein